MVPDGQLNWLNSVILALDALTNTRPISTFFAMICLSSVADISNNSLSNFFFFLLWGKEL